MHISVVPNDVKIRKGKVLFGICQKGDTLAIALPQFDIHGYAIGKITRLAKKINQTSRLRKNGGCEQLLKQELPDMDTRVTIENGHLVPYDQEAASALLELGIPMLKNRHYIPIK